MRSATKKNLHVPMPEDLYRRLREEALRQGRPATEIAREAVDRWLAEARRKAIDDDITAYAREHAGTEADLDPAVEAAAVEHLLGTTPRRRGKK